MNAIFFKNWTNQARKGLLELTILNDIRNRRMYGYEIQRKFRKSKGLLISEGTIYNILRRLKQQRLVKTITTKNPQCTKLKNNQLTKLGTQTHPPKNTYWRAIKQQADSIEQGK